MRSIPYNNFLESSEIGKQIYEIFGDDAKEAINGILEIAKIYTKEEVKIVGVYGNPNEKVASFELKIDGSVILLPYSTLKDF